MTETEPARTPAQKKADSLHRMQNDKDLYISTCDVSGNPCLVVISFYWNGSSLLVSTVETNPTGLNMAATGKARVALGLVRDVTLIETTARLIPENELKAEDADAYIAKLGWDPRKSKGYRFYELVPVWVEAWRELNEHADRVLMRDGNWIV